MISITEFVGDKSMGILEKNAIDQMNKIVSELKELDVNIGEVSDGYHTFNELYAHRTVLFAALVNTLARNGWEDQTWKSEQHHDPDFPMFDGMFIVGMCLPDGRQLTYHCDVDYWDLFHVKELERAPEFDGHSPADVVERLKDLAEYMK